MKPRAFSYLRMSSAAQLAGDSLRRQMTIAREYADNHGLDLQEEDQLHDLGVSAFKGANIAEGAGLGGFIAAVRSGKVPPGSVLLIEDLDRLSRQAILKSIGLLVELLSSNITIVTLSNGRTYTAAAGSGDLILSIISMERAHDESRMKQVRSLAVWKSKRDNAHARPLTSLAPKWLRLSRDRSHFEVIEERAAIVRDVFERAANGQGIYTITARLNRDKVKPFGGTRGPGKSWHCSYVSKLLSNRAVLGEMQPMECVDRRHRRAIGDPVKGYYPAIVSEELWWRVRSGLEQRRGRGGRKGANVANLFAGGLLRCAYCGAAMVRENKGRSNGSSYLCGNARNGNGCVRTRWSYSDFETSFLSFVHEVDIASIVNDDRGRGAELEHRALALRGKLAELRVRQDQTFELMQKTRAVDFVARKLDEIETERSSLEDELSTVEAERAGLNASRHLDEVKPLIEKLSGAGDDAHRLRSAVTSRLRTLVSTVLVAPAGDAPRTKKTIDFLRGQPDSEAVIEHVERISDRRKYFTVVLRDGSFRMVRVSDDDPTKFEEQLVSTHEEGLIRIHPELGGEQIFIPRPTID
jgi:DNA invertase Pin-like site-specific DNA recombinase